jgi:hypothetical protein
MAEQTSLPLVVRLRVFLVVEGAIELIVVEAGAGETAMLHKYITLQKNLLEFLVSFCFTW